MNEEEKKAIENIKELLKYPKWYASTGRETDFLRRNWYKCYRNNIKPLNQAREDDWVNGGIHKRFRYRWRYMY